MVYNPAKLLVHYAKITKSEGQCKIFVPKQRAWKFPQADLCDEFCETFTGEIYDTSGEHADDIRLRLKQGLLSAAEITRGWTKKGA